MILITSQMGYDYGTVHTIVRRNEPVTFGMQLLDRLEGGGPAGTDVILGRASGSVIDELGGLAQGMSGSPVSVGGEIIGAVGRLDRPIAPGFSSPAGSEGGDPPLVPGAAVGAALVIGDVQIGSIGTVTFAHDDLVWAFGHPFLFLGPVELPLMTADILETTRGRPPRSPVRLGRMRRVVGTVLEDRSSAVLGRLGAGPRLVQVRATSPTAAGGARLFSARRRCATVRCCPTW